MAAGLRLTLIAIVAASLWSGCSTCGQEVERPFASGDRFSFCNGLRWVYSFDKEGKRQISKASPAPEYALHCFPMVRAAREFFYHASFEPDLPEIGEEEYRVRVRKVIRRDSRCPSAQSERVIIPGYANLAEFSVDRESLLKDACGDAWNSYAQRGNWRMIFPFSRGSQARTAAQLERKLARGLLPIVHLADFPGLRINHAVLLTAVRVEKGIQIYQAYDPNNAERFAELRFDPTRRAFTFESNRYFEGGTVKVYEVYRNALF